MMKFFRTLIILIIINIIQLSECHYRIINHGPVSPKIISYSRNRRSLPQSSIIISLGNWTLKTQLKNSVILPNDIEINYVNLTVTKTVKISRINCENVQGRVINIKNSWTIITICENDFYGFLNADSRHFVVEPQQNGSHYLQEFEFGGYEGLRGKREVFEKYWNLTGDTFEIDESDSEDYYEEDGENYFSARTWTRANISSEFFQIQRILELNYA